jgi:predicted hydrocarbon binding protein
MEHAQYTHYLPNRLARILLTAMEEILGRNGLNAVLNTSAQPELIHNLPSANMEKEFPFEKISKLNVALEEVYGTLGGRGLAIRAGRSSFKYGLREFGRDLGITEQTFKLQPLNTKIRNGARIMADLLNRSSDQRVELGEDLDYFYWHIHSCPFCWQRETSIPVCYLAVGALQEALYWVSSGKFFSVEEILCTAKGDPTCTIRIGKEPME